MAMAHIRERYNVPAKRGGRITFDGRPAIIIGSSGQYLRVRMADTGWVEMLHPTWEVEYVDPARPIAPARAGEPTTKGYKILFVKEHFADFNAVLRAAAAMDLSLRDWSLVTKDEWRAMKSKKW